MESNFFNRSIIVVGIVATFFGLSVYFLNWKHQETPETQVDYNYEMMRPEDETGQFDLSGREIDRRVLKNEIAEKAQADVGPSGSGGRMANAVGKQAAKKTNSAKVNRIRSQQSRN